MVAALVWLGVQTLVSKDHPQRTPVAYGSLIARVHDQPRSVRRVVFAANRNEIDVQLADGARLRSTYPNEASQVDFQHLLERQQVPFDSRRTSSGSRWWSILTSLLPFVLLFGFWAFLAQHFRRRSERRDEAAP